MRVYCAGPYSSPALLGSLDNMRIGMAMAYHILSLGHSVYVPWFDYHFSLVGPMTLECYQRNSMEWLAVSDVLVLGRGWRGSTGTLNEIERADLLGIPYLEYSVEHIESDLKGVQREIDEKIKGKV